MVIKLCRLTSADVDIRSSELGGIWLMPAGTGGGGACGMTSSVRATAGGVGPLSGTCPLDDFDPGLDVSCICSCAAPSPDLAALWELVWEAGLSS